MVIFNEATHASFLNVTETFFYKLCQSVDVFFSDAGGLLYRITKIKQNTSKGFGIFS